LLASKKVLSSNQSPTYTYSEGVTTFASWPSYNKCAIIQLPQEESAAKS